jgi:hypothetical protein
MVTDERTETPVADAAGGSDPLLDAIFELMGISGGIGGLFGLGGGSERDIISVSFYVEGIGLVQEQVYDITNGGGQAEENIIITRELTSFTGL